MPGSSPIGPGLFSFLTELADHNDKPWFDEHRARFEEHVREPALEFVRQMRAPLRRISEHFTADDSKAGGSLLRMYRDTRFSRDKAPYWTHVAIWFGHERRADVTAPAFMLRLEPDVCEVSVGVRKPGREALAMIRQAIADDGASLRRIVRGKAFARDFTVAGTALARVPKGFDPEHAMADELRRKEHIVTHRLRPRALQRPDAVAEVLRLFRIAGPYARWLCEALDLEF